MPDQPTTETTQPEPTLESIEEALVAKLAEATPATAASIQAQITAAWPGAVAKWKTVTVAGSAVAPTAQSWNALDAALPSLLSTLLQEISP